MNAVLTIGKVASQSGVGVQTVRFYERKGLLKQPVRRPSGYREYSRDDITQIRFIKRAQELGFTLKEVKSLLELQALSEGACGAVRKKADAKRAEVADKIADLKKMLQSLTKISDCCRQKKPATDVCSIRDCFGDSCKS